SEDVPIGVVATDPYDAPALAETLDGIAQAGRPRLRKLSRARIPTHVPVRFLVFDHVPPCAASHGVPSRSSCDLCAQGGLGAGIRSCSAIRLMRVRVRSSAWTGALPVAPNAGAGPVCARWSNRPHVLR